MLSVGDSVSHLCIFTEPQVLSAEDLVFYFHIFIEYQILSVGDNRVQILAVYIYECQTLRLQNMLNFNPQTKLEPTSQTLIDMKLRIILICIAHLLIAPFMKDVSTTNRIEDT